MSEDITIKEGGFSKHFFGVDIVRTASQSGPVKWFPAGSTSEKRITANGVYAAEDEGLFAYTRVTVNVPEGAGVRGRSSAGGNESFVTVDENGLFQANAVPSSIKVTKWPDHVNYGDRAYISYEGLEVTAYKADGTPWEADGYEGGVIPFEELIFTVTQADVNAVEPVPEQYVIGNFYQSTGDAMVVNWQSDDGDNYVLVPLGVKIVSFYNGGDQYVVLVDTLNIAFDWQAYKYRNGEMVIEGSGSSSAYSSASGEYQVGSGNRLHWYSPPPVVTMASNAYDEGDDLVELAVAIAGTGQQAITSGQLIPVQWVCPVDGSTMTTYYPIVVVPAGGGGAD